MARRGSPARHLLILSAAGALAACATPAEPVQVTPQRDVQYEDLPIVGLVYGEYDGHELRIREVTEQDLAAAAEPAEGVGVVGAPLVDLPSSACGSGCTGTSSLGFSNQAGTRHARTNGVPETGSQTWDMNDAANCGATVPATGVCVRVRLRNMFPQQLERVYAEIVELTPTGTTTEVSAVATGWTGVADFGLAPAIPNGLLRYGEIARSTTVAGSPGVWWSFAGTTPPGSTFTFSFLAQVRGLIVNPTQRATLPAGQLDSPTADYAGSTPGTSVAASNVAISGDGRYVAFATNSAVVTGAAGNFVVRKDLTDGSVDRLNPTSCTSATNPHISSDGNVVVFAAHGCDLSGEGTTPTRPQIYAHDFASGVTTLVTRSTAGGYAGGVSGAPRVSADGNVVVFQSSATDLLDSPVTATRPTSCIEVYRYELSGLTLTHVSATRDADIFDPSAGWAANCSSAIAVGQAGETPDVSGDGNFVIFGSGRDLDPTDATVGSNGRDAYVYDHGTSQATGFASVYRVSQVPGTGGALNQPVQPSPSISADGAYVVYNTAATNILPGGGTARHIYRRATAEGQEGTTERVTLAVSDAASSIATTGVAELSASGRFVAFWSSANDLPTDGTFSVGSTAQVYVCDMGAPVSPLERCWVASTVQTTTASSTFAVHSGTTIAAGRIGLAYLTDLDAGYVAYQASWAALGGSGFQTFVSPVGDPRYQQAAPRP